MKALIIGMTLLVVGLVVLFLAGGEVAVSLLFGWIAFLLRVGHRMHVSWPSIGVGVGAFVFFTLGLHVLGRSWRATVATAGSEPWRLRWSLAAASLVVLLFVAGLSLLGIVHQTGWLLSSPEPLRGETVWRTGGGTANMLKQIALGVHNYADAHGSLPSGGTFTADGRGLHSWETQTLGYIAWHWAPLDMQRAWNDPVNAPFTRCVLPEFINPNMPSAPLTDAEGYGLSHYASNCWVMRPNTRLRLADLQGQASTTMLIGEINHGFRPWADPVNWRDPARGINRSPDGFGGPWTSGGAQFLMADGSVRFFAEDVSPDVLRALAHPHPANDVDPGLRPGDR